MKPRTAMCVWVHGIVPGEGPQLIWPRMSRVPRTARNRDLSPASPPPATAHCLPALQQTRTPPLPGPEVVRKWSEMNNGVIFRLKLYQAYKRDNLGPHNAKRSSLAWA